MLMLVKLLVAAALAGVCVGSEDLYKIPDKISKGVFPDDFVFGTSTSSYQVEGGWLDGGKGLSIWDAYSHVPGQIQNGDTGDIANDMYHLYPKDVELMAKYGLKHYRFSIAWNRIFPTGVAPVNAEAIAYYNDLINSLLSHGIEPHVTIYHSETPLALTLYPKNPMPFLDQDNFVKWYSDYATVLFEHFGDRVKHWFTFNEPFCTSVFGVYGNTDPYQIAHSAILAHATTVDIYRTKYQKSQEGTIGIVLNTAHFYPKDKENPDDVEAAARGYDFWYGWFLDPLTRGDYPERMKATCGDRLPTFTPKQKKLIVGSLDFIAINYYFPYITAPGTAKETDTADFFRDMNITSTFDPSWPLSQTGWGMYGPGLRDLLVYTQRHYHLPTYVTENGLAWYAENASVAVHDTERQKYLHDHIEAVGEAILEGANVKGYFIWSFQDNLEWASGFAMTFGLIFIERPSLRRIVKNSLRWYSAVLEVFGNLHGNKQQQALPKSEATF